jgi:uncharacterized membrane protein
VQWATFFSSFAASLVEFVEAFTIVLVVGVTLNWRSAFAGTGLALALLAALVAIFGVTLAKYVPLDALRFVIGAILILFGLKWLKKAILRYSGRKALHDEEAIYEHETAALRAMGVQRTNHIDRFGVAMSFKSVLLEGLEVVFIVITFGIASAHSDVERLAGLRAASLGALTALVLVVVVGALAHAPLRQVPENTLKFTVGVMLTTFGTFWAGEGLGVAWWGEDLALLWLAATFLVVSFALVTWLRSGTSQPSALKSHSPS